MLSLVAVTAFFIAIFGMPNLIKVAKLKRLVDDPEDPRKIHHRSVPTIGGVLIYFVILTNGFFWLSLGEAPKPRILPAIRCSFDVHDRGIYHGFER